MHAVVDPVIDAENEVVPAIRHALFEAHRIAHTTVQCERVACEPLPWAAHFDARGHADHDHDH